MASECFGQAGWLISYDTHQFLNLNQRPKYNSNYELIEIHFDARINQKIYLTKPIPLLLFQNIGAKPTSDWSETNGICCTILLRIVYMCQKTPIFRV